MKKRFSFYLTKTLEKMMNDYVVDEGFDSIPSPFQNENTDVNILLQNSLASHSKAKEFISTPQVQMQENQSNDKSSISKLQRELKALKDQLRLYEEPPDLDEQKLVVDGSKTVKTSLLGSTHVRYQITRSSPNVSTGMGNRKSLSVFRRFSDWVLLHSILVQDLPGKLIPSPPPKKSIGNTEKDFVELRMIQLHAFTKSLARHPVIRTNQYFRKFLCLSNEQWEELTGSITVNANAIPNLRHDHDKRGIWSTGIKDIRAPKTVSYYLKTLGETGLSLLSGLNIGLAGKELDFDEAMEEKVNGGNNKEISDSGPGNDFVSLYRDLAVVSVDKQTYSRFGKNCEAEENKYMKTDTLELQQEQVKKLRWKIYKKSVDAVVSLMSLAKEKSLGCKELSCAFERMFVIEKDNDDSNNNLSANQNLSGIASALERISTIEKNFYKQISAKHGFVHDEDELVPLLYEILFCLSGTKQFYESFGQNGVRDVSDMKCEVRRCRSFITDSLPSSLEKFAEHQISRASANVKVYTELYDFINQL